MRHELSAGLSTFAGAGAGAGAGEAMLPPLPEPEVAGAADVEGRVRERDGEAMMPPPPEPEANAEELARELGGVAPTKSPPGPTCAESCVTAPTFAALTVAAHTVAAPTVAAPTEKPPLACAWGLPGSEAKAEEQARAEEHACELGDVAPTKSPPSQHERSWVACSPVRPCA